MLRMYINVVVMLMATGTMSYTNASEVGVVCAKNDIDWHWLKDEDGQRVTINSRKKTLSPIYFASVLEVIHFGTNTSYRDYYYSRLRKVIRENLDFKSDLWHLKLYHPGDIVRLYKVVDNKNYQKVNTACQTTFSSEYTAQPYIEDVKSDFNTQLSNSPQVDLLQSFITDGGVIDSGSLSREYEVYKYDRHRDKIINDSFKFKYIFALEEAHDNYDMYIAEAKNSMMTKPLSHDEAQQILESIPMPDLPKNPIGNKINTRDETYVYCAKSDGENWDWLKGGAGSDGRKIVKGHWVYVRSSYYFLTSHEEVISLYKKCGDGWDLAQPADSKYSSWYKFIYYIPPRFTFVGPEPDAASVSIKLDHYLLEKMYNDSLSGFVANLHH